MEANRSSKATAVVKQIAERILGASEDDLASLSEEKKTLLGGFDLKSLLAKKDKPAPVKHIDPNIRQLQDDLATRLGAKVQIQPSAKGKGKLVLAYNSMDELDGILSHIK